MRERIFDGSYRVDPGAVADAIIARHGHGGNVAALLSKMLVAQQAAGGCAPQAKPLTGHDAT